jgi:DsbC/DsbD-like thiol-disulfide interchange protein
MLRMAATLSAIAAVALVCLPGMSTAQDATAWATEPHAAARLVAGSVVKTDDGTFLRAGVEIRFDLGWHTYWRDSGDSGVPPTFDFTGSENIKAVTVLWPAPERFPDGAGGYSIGYKHDIIFPLHVVPKDAANGPTIHLKLGYAICEKMCVPADANLKLTFTRSGLEETAIERAELRVPKRVPLGVGDGFAIRSVHREGGNRRERVVVEIAAPEGAPVDLFVEGPTREWSLPLPTLISGKESDVRRFAFDLDGLPLGTHGNGASLTFTAVSPTDAIEVITPID